jgi:hypothetical protein
VTEEQLAKAKSLEGATMQDGTKYTLQGPEPEGTKSQADEQQPEQPGDQETNGE